MTFAEILQLLEAAGQVLSGALKVAGEARATLSTADQAELDRQLAALQARGDADFTRVDAKLATAAAEPG